MHRMRRFLVLVGMAVSSLILRWANPRRLPQLLDLYLPATVPQISRLTSTLHVTYIRLNAAANNAAVKHRHPISPYFIRRRQARSDPRIQRLARRQRRPPTGVERRRDANRKHLWRATRVNMLPACTAQVIANKPGRCLPGLSLQGTPPALGSQRLASLGIHGTSLFDVNFEYYWPALAFTYFCLGRRSWRFILLSLFTAHGCVQHRFSGREGDEQHAGHPQATSPFPVPEPAILIVLLAGRQCGLPATSPAVADPWWRMPSRTRSRAEYQHGPRTGILGSG